MEKYLLSRFLKTLQGSLVEQTFKPNTYEIQPILSHNTSPFCLGLYEYISTLI